MTRFRHFVSALALAVVLAAPGCDKEPTAEEKFLEKIGHDWSLSNVELDDVAVNGAFAGFALSITKNKTFTTTKGNSPIWPASGTFTLKETSSDPGFNLIRSDGIEVAVTSVTDTSLTLSFQFNADGGRGASVSGDYVFELTR